MATFQHVPHQFFFYSTRPPNKATSATTLPKLVLRLADPPVNGFAPGLPVVGTGAPVWMPTVAFDAGARGDGEILGVEEAPGHVM
jgi:hypothetical protein